jgi:SAM-dependent methyltransferase
MFMPQNHQLTLFRGIRNWWKEQRTRASFPQTARIFAKALWEFARDSTPSRQKQRFGDIDFDWDFRMDTTSARVGWRERLLGELHSLYQPTEPAPFREMISRLPVNLCEFTFIDIGSGKGRVLLMAANYPFRRIIGLELLPALHSIALQNLARYKSQTQQCFRIEPVCCDACDFELPLEPLLLYFFHPLSQPDLHRFLAHLQQSLQHEPRAVYAIYHNPVFDFIFEETKVLQRSTWGEHYMIYSNVQPDPRS